MKLSICTDVMGDLSFTDMLDACVKLGVEGVEMTGGGWSRAPHFRAGEAFAAGQHQDERHDDRSHGSNSPKTPHTPVRGWLSMK